MQADAAERGQARANEWSPELLMFVAVLQRLFHAPTAPPPVSTMARADAVVPDLYGYTLWMELVSALPLSTSDADTDAAHELARYLPDMTAVESLRARAHTDHTVVGQDDGTGGTDEGGIASLRLFPRIGGGRSRATLLEQRRMQTFRCRMQTFRGHQALRSEEMLVARYASSCSLAGNPVPDATLNTILSSEAMPGEIGAALQRHIYAESAAVGDSRAYVIPHENGPHVIRNWLDAVAEMDSSPPDARCQQLLADVHATLTFTTFHFSRALVRLGEMDYFTNRGIVGSATKAARLPALPFALGADSLYETAQRARQEGSFWKEEVSTLGADALFYLSHMTVRVSSLFTVVPATCIRELYRVASAPPQLLAASYSQRLVDLHAALADGTSPSPPLAQSTSGHESAVLWHCAAALEALPLSAELEVRGADVPTSLQAFYEKHLVPVLRRCDVTLPESMQRNLVLFLVLVRFVHRLRIHYRTVATVPVVGLVKSGKTTLLARAFGVRHSPGSAAIHSRRPVVFSVALHDTANVTVPPCPVTLVDVPAADDESCMFWGMSLELVRICRVAVVVLLPQQANSQTASDLLTLLLRVQPPPLAVLVCVNQVDGVFHCIADELLRARDVANAARAAPVAAPRGKGPPVRLTEAGARAMHSGGDTTAGPSESAAAVAVAHAEAREQVWKRVADAAATLRRVGDDAGWSRCRVAIAPCIMEEEPGAVATLPSRLSNSAAAAYLCEGISPAASALCVEPPPLRLSTSTPSDCGAGTSCAPPRRVWRAGDVREWVRLWCA